MRIAGIARGDFAINFMRAQDIELHFNVRFKEKVNEK
jgi:hypothetical protein